MQLFNIRFLTEYFPVGDEYCKARQGTPFKSDYISPGEN